MRYARLQVSPSSFAPFISPSRKNSRRAPGAAAILLLAVLVHASPVARAQPPSFETNTITAASDISGVIGTASTAAVITRTQGVCPGAPFGPVLDTLNVSAAGNPGAAYEIAHQAGPGAMLVPAAAGGLVLPLSGEIVNLRLSSLAFLHGGVTPLLHAMPAFPGATGSSLAVPFASTAAVDFGIQTMMSSPQAPGGFELTQGTEYHAMALAPQSVISGPTADDETIVFAPAAPPLCWLPGPWTMYGTSFQHMFVDSNGRLMAGESASDFSPTLIEFQLGPPTVALWTDLDPAAGGSILISGTSGSTISVEFDSVANANVPGTANSFTLEYDDSTGAISVQGGLTGTAGTPFSASLSPTTSSATLIGISPGHLNPPAGGAPGTTDPFMGAGTAFVAGAAAGVPSAGTDMVYDVSSSPALPLSFSTSAMPPLSRIEFAPTVVGGLSTYTWLGL